MARKSRKQAVIQAPETADTNLKVYRTALYARLSADENNRDAGTTIENQLCLLREYVKTSTTESQEPCLTVHLLTT